MRTADERFVPMPRFSSISSMIFATGFFISLAISCSAMMNSSSSEMLVWCPDKDTDNFFILDFSPSKTFIYCAIDIFVPAQCL